MCIFGNFIFALIAQAFGGNCLNRSEAMFHVQKLFIALSVRVNLFK